MSDFLGPSIHHHEILPDSGSSPLCLSVSLELKLFETYTQHAMRRQCIDCGICIYKQGATLLRQSQYIWYCQCNHNHCDCDIRWCCTVLYCRLSSLNLSIYGKLHWSLHPWFQLLDRGSQMPGLKELILFASEAYPYILGTLIQFLQISSCSNPLFIDAKVLPLSAPLFIFWWRHLHGRCSCTRSLFPKTCEMQSTFKWMQY